MDSIMRGFVLLPPASLRYPFRVIFLQIKAGDRFSANNEANVYLWSMLNPPAKLFHMNGLRENSKARKTRSTNLSPAASNRTNGISRPSLNY